MKFFLLSVLCLVVAQGQLYGQTPVPDPIGSGGATAEVPDCEELRALRDLTVLIRDSCQRRVDSASRAIARIDEDIAVVQAQINATTSQILMQNLYTAMAGLQRSRAAAVERKNTWNSLLLQAKTTIIALDASLLWYGC
jgi:hypothetical protein